MKKRPFGILLILLFLTVGPASLPAQQASETLPERVERDLLFLWEIDTGGKPSYLCGSVHMMSRDQFPLPEAMEKTFEKAEILVVEVDITRETDIIDNPTVTMGMYYEGKTIQDVLPSETLAKTEALFDRLGLPLVMFGSFKPWVIASTIVQMRMQQLGFSAELGLDYYFLQQAHEQGKPVEQLETAFEQIEMMNSIPEDLQIAMLEDSLTGTAEFEAELEQIFKTWSAGNTEEMAAVVSGNGGTPELNKALNRVLLTDRNRRMAETIADFLDGGKSYFIVIGAGHLVGEGNIREELHWRGYPSHQLGRE
jgi:uncharacterized protein